jgi:hypothetical protein
MDPRPTLDYASPAVRAAERESEARVSGWGTRVMLAHIVASYASAIAGVASLWMFEGPVALSHPSLLAGVLGAPLLTPVLLPMVMSLAISEPTVGMIGNAAANWVVYSVTIVAVWRRLSAAPRKPGFMFSLGRWVGRLRDWGRL